LSLPESLLQDNAWEFDWAAAALDAAAAAAAAGLDGGCFPGDADGGSAAGDADAVCEAFTALLEAGGAAPSGSRGQQQRTSGRHQSSSAGAAAAAQAPGGSYARRGSSSSHAGRAAPVRASMPVAGLRWQQQPREQHHQQLQRQQQRWLRQSCPAPGVQHAGSGTSSSRRGVLEAQAAAFAARQLLSRAFTAWWHWYVPACRARLLADAATASADAFAAARQQRLLSHCWSGWTAGVLVGASARCAAVELLQRAVQRQVLYDWRAAAAGARAGRQEVVAAWRTATQLQQVRLRVARCCGNGGWLLSAACLRAPDSLAPAALCCTGLPPAE
jgi:hypothetical protein